MVRAVVRVRVAVIASGSTTAVAIGSAGARGR